MENPKSSKILISILNPQQFANFTFLLRLFILLSLVLVEYHIRALGQVSLTLVSFCGDHNCCLTVSLKKSSFSFIYFIGLENKRKPLLCPEFTKFRKRAAKVLLVLLTHY